MTSSRHYNSLNVLIKDAHYLGQLARIAVYRNRNRSFKKKQQMCNFEDGSVDFKAPLAAFLNKRNRVANPQTPPKRGVVVFHKG